MQLIDQAHFQFSPKIGLAVPVMVGASGLTLMKQGLHFTGGEWALMFVGFVVAFLCALVIVRAFIRYLRSHDFIAFGYYRIVVGIVVILVLVVQIFGHSQVTGG